MACFWVRSLQMNRKYETDSAEISYEDPYVKNCPDTVPAWRVKLNIAGESVDFRIDPGADTSIMSWDTYQQFNHKPYLSPTAAVLRVVPYIPGGNLLPWRCGRVRSIGSEFL